MKEYMKIINNKDEFTSATQHTGNNVFVFSANWCPDCRFLEGFMKEVIDAYKEKDFHFYYVDRDDNIEICQELMIMGIPSFVIYKNGEEHSRFVSKLRKTREEIEKFLDEAI